MRILRIAPSFVAAAILWTAAAAAASERPNFIFFITDDISPEDMSVYGGPVPTPNAERLAASGMLFNNAYVTASSCSPSRCSILTSRYPHNTGAPELHTAIPAGQWKFPGRLRKAGYYSVLSGKNHMTYDGKQHRDELLADAFDRISDGGKPSGSEDWIDEMRNRPKDRPFFFWFASHDAHRAWQFDATAPRFAPEAVVVPPYLFDGPQTRDDLAGYYHEVARTDHYLGLLMDEVVRQGIADSTYILYCSDNGRPFPRSKTRLVDSGAKTPLIVAGPDVARGARSSSLISLIDIGPTLLELAGVTRPDRFQGVSFLPVLRNPGAIVRDYVFAEHNWHVYPANERMVRYGNWMYIRNYRFQEQNLCVESATKFPAGQELWAAEARGELRPEQRDVFLVPRPYEELYCVESDPHQFTNLAGSPGHAPILDELRTVMDVWRDETGDSIPANPTLIIGNVAPDQRGEMPGASRDAENILNPGPIRRMQSGGGAKSEPATEHRAGVHR